MELSYFNARVRGLRSGLLGPSKYSDLLAETSPEGLIEGLKATAYGPYVEAAGARFEDPYDVIAAALKAALAGAFSELERHAPPEAVALIRALVFHYEAYSLKAVIRGVARGMGREASSAVVIPAGEFSSPLLGALAGAKDVPDILRFLESWASVYARPVRDGLAAFKKDESLSEIELGIDRTSVERAVDACAGAGSGPVTEAVSLRVDAVNVMTLFKVVGEGYSREGAGGFFMEGGLSLSKKDFVEMAASGATQGLAGAIAARIRSREMRAALEALDPEETSRIEEELDRAIEARLLRLSVMEPLGMALAAAYVYSLVREVKNLRLVAKGVEFGIPGPELERMLRVPGLVPA